MAINYRIAAKGIIYSNINLCNILLRILARLQAEINKGTFKFTKEDIKTIYMQRVDEFETEEEILNNRIYMRKYLRELMVN